ncbi:MAG: ATP-dependent DNA helicase PcrA [Parcubacteria group bacterium Gr01-1014_70]|nr:MAG: ATP-dependent DNA helicase PcrA [Parcubacteria group bacterium Gr01-1014_70]
MNDILTNLNPAQREAVTTLDGPLLVIAGAGSGKTRVLVHRIAYLISQGVNPESILAVTFTNKAAGEMKERVCNLISDRKNSGHTPLVCTFHALGVYLLRRDGHHIGIPRSFTILDEDDALSIVKRIIKEHALDPKQFQSARVRHIISTLKNIAFSGTQESGEEEHLYPKEITAIAAQYEKELTDAHALDFDDLLLQTVALFQKHPEVLSKWQLQWRYILVDEYQDTNHIQYSLMKLLANPSNGPGNIMVVGDVDQAIYSWRGADFRNILSFERDWPQAKIITLDQNYRSTALILEAANAVIKKNRERKEKNLWTERREGPLLELSVAENEREEARFITREIARLRGDGAFLRDMAVLYRTNAQSRVLEESFLKNSIPYRLIGGVRFYERREVKDILAYMRLAANPRDHVSLRRVLNTPPRGIGAVLAEKYFAQKPLSPKEQAHIDVFLKIQKELENAYAAHTPSDLALRIVKQIAYETYLRDGTTEGEERWANVQEILSVTSAYDHMEPPQGTSAFLENAALLSDADLVDRSTDAVHIMTIHAAKGLEFENVFVSGLEEGIFPHALSMHDPAQMEEERRLCYVALTRARTRLYVSTAQTRTLYGEMQWSEPSRFLKDIPEHLIQVRAPKETNYIKYEL